MNRLWIVLLLVGCCQARSAVYCDKLDEHTTVCEHITYNQKHPETIPGVRHCTEAKISAESSSIRDIPCSEYDQDMADLKASREKDIKQLQAKFCTEYHVASSCKEAGMPVPK